MRIALHADGRTIRGNENQLLLAARGLIERGHELHVSTVPGSPTERAFRELGATTTGARPRGDADPLAAARFYCWLRRLRPDAVLLTSWKRAALSAALARAARVPRVVIRIGGEHHGRGTAGDQLRRRALRRWVDAVFVNCEPVRDSLLAYAPGLAAERVHVIPSAVPPFDGANVDLRAELALHPDSPLLFSAGGLEHRKGYHVLLPALAALPHAAVHLAVAGDGPARAALLAQAAALGIADRVHLLGARSDVRGILPAVDAFVLPSRSDSVPIAALEAAAAGLPIVSTAVPGMAEVLAPRVDAPAAGWIVPVGDVAALAAALGEALLPAARDRGAEARRRADREHSPEQLVARLESLLAGPAQRRAASAAASVG